jgi:hypothetical protein
MMTAIDPGNVLGSCEDKGADYPLSYNCLVELNDINKSRLERRNSSRIKFCVKL